MLTRYFTEEYSRLLQKGKRFVFRRYSGIPGFPLPLRDCSFTRVSPDADGADLTEVIVVPSHNRFDPLRGSKRACFLEVIIF